MFQKQEYWEYLLRSKIFQSNERQKLVRPGAPPVLLFLIGKLQDFTSSCSKLFEKFLLLKCYTGLYVLKTTIFKYLVRSKISHPHERQKLVHTGAPLVLLFLIGKLKDLRSSCSKIIAIFIF